MAGKPVTRLRKLSTSLASAIEGGRQEEARLVLAEIRRVADDAGLPIPALPPEANELWLTITEAAPTRATPRPAQQVARLTDEVRADLIRAGELAAGHLLNLMAADGLWGPYGLIPPDKQVGLVSQALNRAYGPMPIGAQKVNADLDDIKEPETPMAATLSLMIRQAQSQKAEPRDITPDDAEDAA